MLPKDLSAGPVYGRCQTCLRAHFCLSRYMCGRPHMPEWMTGCVCAILCQNTLNFVCVHMCVVRACACDNLAGAKAAESSAGPGCKGVISGEQSRRKESRRTSQKNNSKLVRLWFSPGWGSEGETREQKNHNHYQSHATCLGC